EGKPARRKTGPPGEEPRAAAFSQEILGHGKQQCCQHQKRGREEAEEKRSHHHHWKPLHPFFPAPFRLEVEVRKKSQEVFSERSACAGGMLKDSPERICRFRRPLPLETGGLAVAGIFGQAGLPGRFRILAK